MLRSMYSAISGMQAFQTDLDVVGNNIANVNTIGFKAGRADFADVFSQTVAGATQGSAPGVPTGSTQYQGGVNPQQIGLGTRVAAISNLFTQGADQTTGVATDCALNGSGLFVVSPNPTATPPSYFYTREGDFNVDAAGNLVLPNGMIVMGTTNTPSSNPPSTTPSSTAPSKPININTLNTDLQTNQTFTLSQNPNLTIGQDGSVNVMGTDNKMHTIAYLSLATFSNYGGLQKVGNSMWQQSNNSGTPEYQTPSSNSATIQSGALEMSNVDLTREFSEMIVAQNGFAANSKLIGTDNSILQDVVNMKNS